MIVRKQSQSRRKRRRTTLGTTLGISTLFVAGIIQVLSAYNYIKRSSKTGGSAVSNSRRFDRSLFASAPIEASLEAQKNSRVEKSRKALAQKEKPGPSSPTEIDGFGRSKQPQIPPPVFIAESTTWPSSGESEEYVQGRCFISSTVESSFVNDGRRKKKDDHPTSSCAILFFGLPRSFKLFVLPSIIENIIVPNLDNNCDYYLHYHAVASEGQNRAGESGGTINGNDVFLLEDAIRRTTAGTGKGAPRISITNSTIEDFEKARGKVMILYETARDENGEYLYFPYNAASWEYPNTIRNMVKQWHSIDAVWQHMEENAKALKKSYSRVAMLRNDVMYVTPFDMYSLSNNERDIGNNHVVVPDWANYPVNDRMIAGPYDAVKVWATERFQRIESHVRDYPIPGWGMHSEKFMNFSIFPAMLSASKDDSKKLSSSLSPGYVLDQNPSVCFLRARADWSVWIEDCNDSFDCDMEPVVLQLLAKYYPLSNDTSNTRGVNCTRKSIEGIKYQDVVSCRGDVEFKFQ
mmetsp:Transcript_25395/g.54160  ORF Transcript_25395/g.54160 Transcript_25395/m.54160 type:complete len:520 (+) Transcript_25395:48-1607(+)|eukprot:CAMPEP_0201225016 /NCGR_PEP_ID=MMETSP0851-20130426/193905_1 /ASSEMBLY_ACC=CAM_ASM_000631 /TAXON_ID=183588 /ORGANISM="Pseudo-nitzschia fraudulenta, Strain WWA7" /LENGTH=519 /DNA_ID=CAMNT_0047514785 /DNA_START=141 /DNA_END=1700 /DNA_ORIENTATION=+